MKQTKQTTPMTFAELVDETVAYYSNNPRSLSADIFGACKYAGPNGERCAAARLCDESVTDLRRMDASYTSSWEGVFHLATLKPEYEHFNDEQIADLQTLHDMASHWIFPDGKDGTGGLSVRGEKFVEEIKAKHQTH